MDRLDAMQVMLTVVECGSLSNASRTLGQPLATVSRKVSDLESHLKADLLIRSSKVLELTSAGRTYITAARTILEQLNEAERAAAGEYTEPKGDLVVTAPTMFGRLHALPVVTTGAYLQEAVFPSKLGYETAGLVQSLGENVADFAKGEAVSVIPTHDMSRWPTNSEVINIFARHAVIPTPRD